MRIFKFFMAAALVAGLTGCTCWKKNIGPAENIPVAAAGEDIHFDFDRYNIRPDAQAILDRQAAQLKAKPALTVKIEGHCDERGTAEYNMALGQRRADSARDYLRAQGIEASRLSTISYGKELPLDPGHNEAAWAKNRRAHFVYSE